MRNTLLSTLQHFGSTALLSILLGLRVTIQQLVNSSTRVSSSAMTPHTLCLPFQQCPEPDYYPSRVIPYSRSIPKHPNILQDQLYYPTSLGPFNFRLALVSFKRLHPGVHFCALSCVLDVCSEDTARLECGSNLSSRFFFEVYTPSRPKAMIDTSRNKFGVIPESVRGCTLALGTAMEYVMTFSFDSIAFII